MLNTLLLICKCSKTHVSVDHIYLLQVFSKYLIKSAKCVLILISIEAINNKIHDYVFYSYDFLIKHFLVFFIYFNFKLNVIKQYLIEHIYLDY